MIPEFRIFTFPMAARAVLDSWEGANMPTNSPGEMEFLRGQVDTISRMVEMGGMGQLNDFDGLADRTETMIDLALEAIKQVVDGGIVTDDKVLALAQKWVDAVYK